VSALLAVVAAALAWLGFAGVGWWPLALVGFVPLFAALERAGRAGGWRVFWVGLLFGSVLWGAARRRDCRTRSRSGVLGRSSGAASNGGPRPLDDLRRLSEVRSSGPQLAKRPPASAQRFITCSASFGL